MNNDNPQDEDTRPVPIGDRFSLWFYCDGCHVVANCGAELKNRTDGRILKICKECLYNLGIVKPGQEPKIWRKMGISR